jgi:glycosyltransferase involved in cell wall biosynthesis
MKHESTSISILTPVLNGWGKIERTIESVANQVSHRAEYIVIDGGSTDATPEILRANRGTVTSWISEPDQGINHAFNKGIQMAKGGLVGILNAGDWYEPGTLSLVADACGAHAEVDVFCGSIQFWEGGSPTLVCRSNPATIENETSIYHPTVFIRKSAYQRFGVYDESYRLAMDYELLLRFKKKGAKFLVLDKTLTNMPLDGVSSKHWYRGLQEVRRARSAYFPFYNVLCFHVLAVVKNLTARALKKIGLRSVYNAYWHWRNSRRVAGLDSEGRG